jgi:ECF transporter S component (folate family)
MLVAISIICGKYLALRGGDIMRFSLENMPIIFAGMAFGPVAGGLVGLTSDIVGCIMVGYTINPIVAVGATAIGIIAGVLPSLLKKTKLSPLFILIITVGCAHFIGSIIIKTAGLYVYYEISLIALILWRVLNYVIVGAVDTLTLHILFSRKEIRAHIKMLGGKE